MTNKHALPTAALVSILVFSAGVIFPLVFAMSDKILRSFLQGIDPLALKVASFIWLLIFYFYGIKFSIEYITRQFVVDEPQKLFTYSTIAYTGISLTFYATLISSSALSNVIWGSFYLATVFFFYFLAKRAFIEVS